jgi:hypothetical protein
MEGLERVGRSSITAIADYNTGKVDGQSIITVVAYVCVDIF